MHRDWTTDGVAFAWRDDILTIRDKVGQGAWGWLLSLALFGLVALVGESYLLEAARGVMANGLVEHGRTGFAAYAEALGGLALILFIVGAVVLAWARPVFGGHEVLEISAKTITLTNHDFGVAWRRRTFQRAEMTDAEYAAVASTDTTSIYAVRFRIGKRLVKVFEYITPEAAAEVIDAMYGYRPSAED